MAKHLLSISDLSQDEFLYLIDRSAILSARENQLSSRLAGRNVGVYFLKTSTRTRTSFIVGTTRMGGFPVVFGPTDLQTSTGETLCDTVRVLSGYLDALVMRTAAAPEELRALAALDCIPIINAMTEDEHPTQAISDLAMIARHFGRLRGLRMLYVGEGNNTAAAIALAVSRVAGMELVLLTPQSYGLTQSVLTKARSLSKRFGGTVSEEHGFDSSFAAFDIVYATRWQTTGTTKADPLWHEQFVPFRVTDRLMKRYGRDVGTIFMHDLPAVRGEDCDASVLDGSQSIAFPQAQQKLYTAMAIMEWCIGGPV